MGIKGHFGKDIYKTYKNNRLIQEKTHIKYIV